VWRVVDHDHFERVWIESLHCRECAAKIGRSFTRADSDGRVFGEARRLGTEVLSGEPVVSVLARLLEQCMSEGRGIHFTSGDRQIETRDRLIQVPKNDVGSSVGRRDRNVGR